MRKWFGTDGIRGLANDYLTPELAFKLAQACAHTLNLDESPLIIIGRDTRISGQMIESALVAGFCSMGCRVELLGVMPTPAVAWMVKNYQASMGIMISASHNPAPDNGIKLFNSEGLKLSDNIEMEIEKYIDHPEIILNNRVTGSHVGTLVPHNISQSEAYLDMLFKVICETPLKGFKVLLDAGHGATYKMAEALFSRLECDYSILNTAPNGMNINENCGSTHIEALKSQVIEQGFDMAFAFDGDGDRCLAMDAKGQVVDGDHIMYLLSQYLPEMENERSVVSTVMSNWGFEQALEKKGLNLIRTQVGDRYVLEKMIAQNHFLGGEQSGHLIFTPYQVTGDGLLTSILCLKALVNSQLTLHEIISNIPQIPQLLKNVKMSPKHHKSWDDNTHFMGEVTKLTDELNGRGRLLVRASGTEPKLRIMAEGQNAQEIDQVVNTLVELAQEVFA